MSQVLPRSLRMNNPGNVRVGINWQGLMPRADMTPEQAAEKSFCVFKSAPWGFRAMATILLNYHKLHHLNTIREFISTWAPPNENDTQAYVNDVARQCGADPDAPYDLSDPAKMVPLCRAISRHEAGGWFFAEADLAQGVAWAEGPRPMV